MMINFGVLKLNGIFWESHDKMQQIGFLKHKTEQKLSISQIWRLEVQIQGIIWAIFSLKGHM